MTNHPGLPGGVSRLRAWRFLLRPYGTVIFQYAFVTVLSVTAYVNYLVVWEPARPYLIAAGVALGLWWWLPARYAPAGARVTRERQPDVYALVRDTAAMLDLPLPDRIWLGPKPEVVGQVRHGRRELVIGLPLVYAMPRTELAALVAHELSVLATPGSTLVIRLYRNWMWATLHLVHDSEDGHSPRGDEETLEGLDSLGRQVEEAADARLPDARTAALAFVRVRRTAVDFFNFWSVNFYPVTRRSFGILRRRYMIEDVHDGWRRRVIARGGTFGSLDITDEDAAAVASCHPGLATAVRELVGQPLEVSIPADALPVSRLSRREQRRLAKKLVRWATWKRLRRLRWRTFESAPLQLWRRAAARFARRTLDLVATVLGREPVDVVEAAEVIRARTADVDRAWAARIGITEESSEPRPTMHWIILLEHVLLERGWVHTDPAVPGMLRAPDGTELDLVDFCRRAASDPATYAELLRLLREPWAYGSADVRRRPSPR